MRGRMPRYAEEESVVLTVRRPPVPGCGVTGGA